MPTKTKRSSSSSKKTVKNTATDKKVVSQKKVANKNKLAVKKTAGKASSKRPSAKKVTKSAAKKAPKSSVKKNIEKKTDEPVVVLKFDTKAETIARVHHKYVRIDVCKNCEHMPMSVNKLVALLSIVIAILSGLLISTSLPINFRMPSISMGKLAEWIVPTSNVRNL